ncbi:hypothetical protein PsB1_2304 [Candidatus Phycosocius spiralis]|uniref:Uncharacterized protein n=1 Tax=Candidatus Phycosocius spiralis TaxID=2815099 RepID=A0ABQ4PZ03_9PROT|nr:hypothetical protein PsB1_2304 [Candidatus Phycosocius spiralis]
MAHCYPSLGRFGLESLALLHCYPSLGRFGLESLALLVSGGLVSPAEIANIIGGIFPIAL